MSGCADLTPISPARARELSAASLAFVGDTVYDLYVRSYIVKNHMAPPDEMNRMAIRAVKAEAQAQASALLSPILTEDEEYMLKRGRNAKTGAVPRHAEVAQYRWATGLETLVGYLFLTGGEQRLNELFDIILSFIYGDRGEELAKD